MSLEEYRRSTRIGVLAMRVAVFAAPSSLADEASGSSTTEVETSEFQSTQGEALAVLRSALDTLMVREETIPLPVLGAELLLATAEEQLNAPPSSKLRRRRGQG